MTVWHPKPAPPGLGKDRVLPEKKASILSRLWFTWLSPLLSVGFSRPLQEDDLWILPENQHPSVLADKFEISFYRRCPPEKRPQHLKKKLESLEQPKKYDESLLSAYHSTFVGPIWVAGAMKLAADTLRTTTPIVSKVFLTWLTESYVYHKFPGSLPTAPKGIGYGIGIAFGIFFMEEVASILDSHYMVEAMRLGMFIRSGTIGLISRKSLRLSPSSLAKHSAGQINTMIGGDASRIDEFTHYAHYLWIAPVEIAICIGLLIHYIGYSALAGFAIMVISMPIQGVLVFIMYHFRKKCLEITDSRTRAVREILNAVRLVKLYAWEEFYIRKVCELREREVRAIRRVQLALSGLISNLFFVPIASIIISFITYGLTGHELTVPTVFASFQLFNVIQGPISFLPWVLNSYSDALVASKRIVEFLTAEELQKDDVKEEEQVADIEVEGDFVWELPQSAEKDEKGKTKDKKGQKEDDTKADLKGDGAKQDKPSSKWWKRKGKATPDAEAQMDDQGQSKDEPLELQGLDKGEAKDPEEQPFELQGLKLRIPHGSFVALVGRIGSGKSSVLQAMIGEMRRKNGYVKLNSQVAYVPQTPWIRNATIRDNILFNAEERQDRLSAVIHACALEHDLDTFSSGLETEIGERGVNLSGGQKARVSLARAAYSDAPVVILDDPLSAVDAHVGEHISKHCLLEGPLCTDESGRRRTRILATHALGVTRHADWIYVIDGGKIVEEGTYEALMGIGSDFARLIKEYGTKKRSNDPAKPLTKITKKGSEEKSEASTALMQEEERNVGAVPWSTYAQYLRYAGGTTWAPWIIGILILLQGCSVGTSLVLSFWTSRSIEGWTQGQYMALYAGLGGAQAVLAYILSYSFSAASLIASLAMFKDAFRAVIHSPMSFFDTTPTGRILSRFSKDQEILDAELAMVAYGFLFTVAGVFGMVALVLYTFPYLGIIFAPMVVLYYIVAVYYRRSSIELKRLDAVLRSGLYVSLNETLTGLPTIRAYNSQVEATHDAESKLAVQNRAYFMTIVVQRWLSIRLQLFANIIILGIGLFAAGFRHTVDPSKTGVVLSYTLSITVLFSEMITNFATTEQNMNAVERVLNYTQLPPEGALTSRDDPPANWPQKGKISFQDVELAYRPGLPLVLKGISFEVKPGERIGVVGRTGAGKTSLLQALYRSANLRDGCITIDDVDISTIGLETLRSRLALVPQDSALFFGTLRDNLDPQRSRTDAELISALQRSWLIPAEEKSTAAVDPKFTLDATIGDDGSNYSAGEKQLLALARALVKDSQIIVLDEATSSVDFETDAKLQQTIRTEFRTKTLICIAHRLNTILHYDRILVMSDGNVAEFDTALNLFDNEQSIFRSLCDEAGIVREDITKTPS